MKWQENADVEIGAQNHEKETRESSTASTVINTSFLVSNDSTEVNDEEAPGINDVPNNKEEQKSSQSALSSCMSISRKGKIAAADEDNQEQDKVKESNEVNAFIAPAIVRLSSAEEKKKLVKTGMTTAAAVALHNFPEGLATFVAALHDPFTGKRSSRKFWLPQYLSS